MVSFKQCEELFVENGLEYSEKLHEKLCIYYEFLIEYNKKVNLTAITECEEVWVKYHYRFLLVASLHTQLIQRNQLRIKSLMCYTRIFPPNTFTLLS